jgi:hypothetical protein
MMTAQDNLNGAQFEGKYLYHETHLSNRESIRSSGLEPHKPFTPRIGDDVYPKGVYLSQPGGSEYGSSMHDSAHFGYDKWRVDVSGLGVQKDPDPGHSTSWYTPGQIPPERMKLARKGSPDWERNI